MFCKTMWSVRGKKTQAISTESEVDTVDTVVIEIESQFSSNKTSIGICKNEDWPL